MHKKQLLNLINTLKTVQYYTDFQNSGFSQLFPEEPYPIKESEVDKFIKSRTRKLRKDKIYDPLTKVIAELQKELSK